MRIRMMIAAGLSAAALTSPVRAQEVRVITAGVAIPDFLQLATAPVSETVQSDGTTVTRTVVRVSANRSWSLTMNVAQPQDLISVMVNGRTVSWGHSLAEGGKGNSMPVQVEIRWNSASSNPPAVSYQLSSS